MTAPNACTDCLRRSWLLSLLGPYVERATLATDDRSPLQFLALPDEELATAVAPRDGARVLADLRARDEAWFRDELAAGRCWAVCRHDPDFPAGLRDLDDQAGALIGRGDPDAILALDPSASAAVVGARRATSYGRQVARDLGRELATAGLFVVSGLSFGVEACAHRGALEANGATIAVLGCGPDLAYPPAHRALWGRIGETGAVVSELPPGSTPWRWSILARRRVMAALAGMTVVVEAAAGSESLRTAELAAIHGREIGAVPGPVNSRLSVGPNGLLAGGACVVVAGDDVQGSMRLVHATDPAAAPVPTDLDGHRTGRA